VWKTGQSHLCPGQVRPDPGTHSGGLQAALQHISTEDDDFMHNLEELMASHPMIAKRIDQIRIFANTHEYSRWQSMMNNNLSS
jgi:hypothetical protein